MVEVDETRGYDFVGLGRVGKGRVGDERGDGLGTVTSFEVRHDVNTGGAGTGSVLAEC